MARVQDVAVVAPVSFTGQSRVPSSSYRLCNEDRLILLALGLKDREALKVYLGFIISLLNSLFIRPRGCLGLSAALSLLRLLL